MCRNETKSVEKNNTEENCQGFTCLHGTSEYRERLSTCLIFFYSLPNALPSTC